MTGFRYDRRARQVFFIDAQTFDGQATYSRVELDNLGRATQGERHYDADNDASFPSDGSVNNGDRLLEAAERHPRKVAHLGARRPAGQDHRASGCGRRSV